MACLFLNIPDNSIIQTIQTLENYGDTAVFISRYSEVKDKENVTRCVLRVTRNT